MSEKKYVIIDCDVLPDVFAKVMDVKHLLACGEEKSQVSACRRAGISRSAFYKYKDSIFAYEEKQAAQVISLYAVLRDEPGVLSSVLAMLHSKGANILTLNQSIPVDGAAAVTLTLRSVSYDGQALAETLSDMDGVIGIRVIL